MNGLSDWNFNQLLGRQDRQFNQALGWGQKREAAGLSNLSTLANRANLPLGQGYGTLPGGGGLGGTKQLLRLAQAQDVLTPDADARGFGNGMGPGMGYPGGMVAGPVDPREQLARNQAFVANRNLFNTPQEQLNARYQAGQDKMAAAAAQGRAQQKGLDGRVPSYGGQKGLDGRVPSYGGQKAMGISRPAPPSADPYAGIMKRAQVDILDAQARQERAKASAMSLAAKPQSTKPTGSLGSMNPAIAEQSRDAINSARANTALQNAPQYTPSALPNFQSASPGSAYDSEIKAGQEFRAITDQGSPLQSTQNAAGVNRTTGTNGVPGYSQTGGGGGTTNALVPGSLAWDKIKGTNSRGSAKGGSAPGASAGKK